MPEQAAHDFLAARRAEILAETARRAPALAGGAAAAEAEILLDAILGGLAARGEGPRAGELGERLVAAIQGGAPLPEVLARLGVVRRGLLVSAAAAALQGLEGAAAVIARIDELSEGAVARAAAAHEQALEEARRAHAEDEAHHRALYRRLPVMMHSIDAKGRLTDVNDCWLKALGYTREEVLGRPSTDFLTEESRRHAREVVLPEYFRTGITVNAAYQFVKKEGGVVDVLLSAVCDRDAAGNIARSYAVLIDVTDLRRAEEMARQSAVQAETIRAQEEMLRALSTPLVPLGAGAVLMPLIGAVDRARAEQIMEALLQGVVGHAASVAILDVTGVPAVDEEVAAAIARATRAVKLLGAEVVLTGLAPRAARTLVELGVELGSVVTRGTLRDGIAYALRRAEPRRPVAAPSSG